MAPKTGSAAPRKRLVGLGGLEPPTSRLSSARSNQLSYKPLDCAVDRCRHRGEASQGQAAVAAHAALTRSASSNSCVRHVSDNLVGLGGLEPPTPRLSSVCSNQLSYWPRSCGVAQSREGCAVGARHGLHHGQARRQGRYVSNNQETSVRGCPTPRSHPEPDDQARTKRCLVMSDVTQGSRKTRQADILERR